MCLSPSLNCGFSWGCSLPQTDPRILLCTSAVLEHRVHRLQKKCSACCSHCITAGPSVGLPSKHRPQTGWCRQWTGVTGVSHGGGREAQLSAWGDSAGVKAHCASKMASCDHILRWHVRRVEGDECSVLPGRSWAEEPDSDSCVQPL